MRLKIIVVSAVFFFFFCAVPGYAQHFFNEYFGRRTNVKFDSFYCQMLKRTVKYAVYLPPSYFEQPNRSYPVLYYIHGFDLKGKALMDWVNWNLDVTLDALIKEGSVEEMIVAMPSADVTGIVVNWGRPPARSLPVETITFPYRALRGLVRSFEDITYLGSYLYVQRWDLTPADYTDFLIAEFFPQIENNYRVKKGRSNRAITGFSTGGYSSLSIAFQHPELFDSVGAHAPMIVLCSPFSPEAEQCFVEYDPERSALIPHEFIINLLKRIFQNQEAWERQNPVYLARVQPLDDLPVYVDVADKDKRGYDTGVCTLVSILSEQNVPVKFELVRGLPAYSSHTYPGFLNGKAVAELAEGMTDKEADRYFHWNNVKALINPNIQQIEHSLIFQSREFMR
jgi:S-formylglutathione hydrolase FrmB